MTLYQLPDGQSQASRGTMTCFTRDYDLVHGGPLLTNFTDEHDPLTGLHDSLCKFQEIKTCAQGWGGGLEQEHGWTCFKRMAKTYLT